MMTVTNFMSKYFGALENVYIITKDENGCQIRTKYLEIKSFYDWNMLNIEYFWIEEHGIICLLIDSDE